MSTSRQVKDIATALVLEAVDMKLVPNVCADVRLLSNVFAHHVNMVADLEESAVPLNIRQDALRAACGSDIHPLAMNAFLLLQRASSLSAHEAFATAVVAQAEERANHHTGIAISAVQLTTKEMKELSTVIENKFSGSLDLSFATDPSILGGLIVTVGDWQCDASVKGNIDRLHVQLVS